MAKRKTQKKKGPSVPTLVKFDMDAHIQFELTHNTETTLRHEGVREQLESVTIKSGLTTKIHQFDDGRAPVASKLFIEVNFGDAVVQPHNSFQGDFCARVCDVIEAEINGMYESEEEPATLAGGEVPSPDDTKEVEPHTDGTFQNGGLN